MSQPEPVIRTAAESDEQVIEQVRRGDRAAYEIIVRRYNQHLFRVTRSILQNDDAAQDAVQETWIAVWFRLDRFKPGTGFGAWLTRIAINEALMIRRKNRRHDQQRDAGDISEKIHIKQVEISEPAEAVLREEFIRLVEKAVDRLPDEFRTVFVLRAVQQLSVKETASCLDIKTATVKTRYHRARNLMQAALGQQLDTASPNAFEFAGARCDQIVARVYERLELDTPAPVECGH